MLCGKSLLVATSLAVIASASVAAEMDDMLVTQEAAEYVPSEIGSGWYLRGDIGYVANEPYDSFGGSGRFDWDETPITGSVGVGYKLNEFLRAELDVGILPTQKFSTGETTGSNKAFDGMAHLYADLGTFAGFTPYLGGGLGVISSRFEHGGLEDSERQNSLVYALSAGVAWQATDKVSLDLGYQYKAAPDLHYATVDDGVVTVGEGSDYHTIRIGLRYDLW